MKLPGNVPMNVFKRQMALHLDETLPKVVTRYWRFSADHDILSDHVRVVARYKKWNILVVIDPVKWGLLSGGLVLLEREFGKHFWFLSECADEEEMYAKLLLAHKPEKVA